MGRSEMGEKIDALAKEKLSIKMGVRRELRKLPERLDEDEDVITLAAGAIGSKRGILVVTDRRLLLFVAGMVSRHLEEFPYRAISSIDAGTKMMYGKLGITVSGNKAEIKDVHPKEAVNEIAAYVRSRIGGASPAPAPAAPAGDTAADRLRKLSTLKDDGLITEAEYESKRAELLAEL